VSLVAVVVFEVVVAVSLVAVSLVTVVVFAVVVAVDVVVAVLIVAFSTGAGDGAGAVSVLGGPVVEEAGEGDVAGRPVIVTVPAPRHLPCPLDSRTCASTSAQTLTR